VNHSDLPIVRRLRPSFLILGAPKAGTTAMFAYLSRHPSLRAPAEKEIDYFWVPSRYGRGEHWYESHFPVARQPGTSTFEATPHYLACPNSPSRIFHYRPDMKLIILLREPISRAYSQYQHYLRKVGDHDRLQASAERYDEPVRTFFLRLRNPGNYGSFAEEVRRELAVLEGRSSQFVPGFLAGGFYERQLRRYLEVFPRRQLLLIETRRLRERPLEVLRQVARFLELPSYEWDAQSLVEHNAGNYRENIDAPTLARLTALFADHNQRLFALLGEEIPHWTRATLPT
jgi:hypothetical protein